MSKTVKVQFKGHDGDSLDARFEKPDGEPTAYALFAHCFSCSKESLAASRISRNLVRHGFAVLRFDFTGLGASEGDFSNTNFSSNVEDLVAAADWLKSEYGRCDLLIGHSLGGAAALVAGGKLPYVKALATLGAPADADHVLHHMSSRLDEIETTGSARVMLQDREFTIKKQFVDDVSKAGVLDATKALKRPLMILHAPLDNVVGVDNATKLFVAAHHPKSFISLDHADHLISRQEDAEFAADTIAAWAKRYVSAPKTPDESLETIPRGTVRVTETGAGGYANAIITGDHNIPVDEPQDHGGLDTGPTPTEYLSAALAACTSITLRMYLNRKKWPADHISVDVSFTRAEQADENGWHPVTFKRELNVTGALSEDQKDRLIEIANKCPVHKILHHPSEIVTVLR